MKYKLFNCSNLIKKNQLLSSFLIFFVLLLVAQILGFEISYYLLIIHLGFCFNIIIFKGKTSLLVNLLLSWFTGTAIFISFSSITNILSLPINKLSISIFFLISFVIFIINKQDFNDISKQEKLDRFDLLVLFISIASLLAKVISLREYYAPILHDPIAHSEWAKIIVTTGYADYFYSPGLHFLAAIGEILGSFETPKQILIITNIFNAFLGIPVYVFLKLISRENWWAVIAALLFNLGPYPMLLYLNAGKNALIVSTGYIFLILIVLLLLNNRKYKNSILILNLLILTLLFSHYPIAIIGSIFIFSYVFVNLKEIKYFLLLSFGYILGGYWIIIKYLGQNVDSRFTISNNQEFNPTISLIEIRSLLTSYWEQALVYIQARDLGDYILVLGIIGLIVLIISSFNIKENRWVLLSIVIFIIMMIVIKLFFYSKLGLIFKTQIIFSFVLFYISSSFVIGVIIIPYLYQYMKFLPILLIVVIIIATMIMANTIYIDYQKTQSTRNMVSEDDLILFNWIEENIDSEDIILNNGVKNDINKNIIFQSDSGAWIPAFTSKNIAIPFSEKSSSKTFENYSMQQKLMKNPANCDVINYFKDNKVNYYFQPGKTVFGEQLLIPDYLLEKDIYRLIYKSGNSKLYQIIGCH